jgi:hypothetical protein
MVIMKKQEENAKRLPFFRMVTPEGLGKRANWQAEPAISEGSR